MSCLLPCTVRKVRISPLGFLSIHIPELPPKDHVCLGICTHGCTPTRDACLVLLFLIQKSSMLHVCLSPVFSRMCSTKPSQTGALGKKEGVGGSMIKSLWETFHVLFSPQDSLFLAEHANGLERQTENENKNPVS